MSTCADCKFGFVVANNPAASHVCRRFPPQIIVTERDKKGARWQAIFPPMQADGWCGEHKGKSK
jgi:hypothetical protein